LIAPSVDRHLVRHRDLTQGFPGALPDIPNQNRIPVLRHPNQILAVAKNQRLRRELARATSRVWTREPSGLVVRALKVPIDGEKIEKLAGFIVRGLMWHHWNIVLGPDCFVDVLSLTERGEAFFDRYRRMRASDRVRGDIGNGALVYQGAQGTDNPKVSVWELSIYGGAKMAGADGADLTSKFGVMTGPQSIKHRADACIRRGAFILTA
jgi:hypothetical protein